mmetsp:Transcript_892/g.1354  ORF Transcript_892/g.1354 Transcript_892/m.1354 type:complete len:784 (-) Transcript_892:91-2442(-)
MSDDGTIYKCSICGKDNPDFSKRQLNKAMFGEPARCKTCIEKNSVTNDNNEEMEDKAAASLLQEEASSVVNFLINAPREETKTPVARQDAATSKAPNKGTTTEESSSPPVQPKTTGNRKQKVWFSDGEYISGQSSCDEEPTGINNLKGKPNSNRTNEETTPDGESVSDRSSSEVDDEEEPNSEDQNLQMRIPRKKRTKLKDKQKINRSLVLQLNSENDDDDNDSDENHEVSLDALKQKVMGRKIKPYSANDEDDDIPDISNFKDLRKELTCPICHECLYEPISLPCGHSFCQSCVSWWFTRGQNDRDTKQSCPTCRQSHCIPDLSKFGINTGLRACVIALLGEEVEARRKGAAKLKCGEEGGRHGRGHEIISSIGDDEWSDLRSSSTKCSARRSIVLDANDQRMQLTLALRSDIADEDLVIDDDVLKLNLCLLHMEEDEASDGIPWVVRDDGDDAHLVCKEDEYFSHVQLSVKDGIYESGGEADFTSVSRKLLGQDGIVSFSVNFNELSDDNGEMLLWFCHVSTGAELEIQISSKSSPRCNSVGSAVPASTKPARYFQDEDYEEDEETNEYENDGFLVGDDEDIDTEGEDSHSEEDDDLCAICSEGGDLMVCDGGEHMEGCGKSFHVECIGRSVVPEGDWICCSCASAMDENMSFGKEGYEFKSDDKSDCSEEVAERQRKNGDKQKRQIDDVTQSDDTEDGEFVSMSKKSKRNTPPRDAVDDDSDEELEFVDSTDKRQPSALRENQFRGDLDSDDESLPTNQPLHEKPSAARRKVIDDDSDSD